MTNQYELQFIKAAFVAKNLLFILGSCGERSAWQTSHLHCCWQESVHHFEDKLKG